MRENCKQRHVQDANVKYNSGDVHQKDGTITDGTIQSKPTPDDATSQHPVPPDGGYGWIIMVASFFNSLIIDGVCFRYDI